MRLFRSRTLHEILIRVTGRRHPNLVQAGLLIACHNSGQGSSTYANRKVSENV